MLPGWESQQCTAAVVFVHRLFTACVPSFCVPNVTLVCCRGDNDDVRRLSSPRVRGHFPVGGAQRTTLTGQVELSWLQLGSDDIDSEPAEEQAARTSWPPDSGQGASLRKKKKKI